MAIEQLDQFLLRFFQAHHCEILKHEEGLLSVQLTEEMDRALTNRPFYWHYIKKMGQVGNPMQLTFITDHEREVEKGEKIHFGGPRLQQIWNHLVTNERFTKLFQSVQAIQNTALYPWLVINVKLSYIGKHKRDEIFSIGLNLVNGVMKTNMMEELEQIELQMNVSDYCYTISPIITLKSGYKRIEAVLLDYIKRQDHHWADDSLQELSNEKELLNHFYNNSDDEEKKQMDKEFLEIEERYTPTINLSVVNGGIFYLLNQK